MAPLDWEGSFYEISANPLSRVVLLVGVDVWLTRCSQLVWLSE